MIKVLTVVGTRPEVIRLSRIIAKLDRLVHHVLVHTGQNYDYELNEIFFDQMALRSPDYNLRIAKSRPMETIGNILDEVDKILCIEKPDAFLVLGDTNSALSCLAAKRRKIPIFHMEAGNRCFDINVPEEINRKIVDHIADINLPYSQLSREMLIAEGLKPELSIVTGSPMKEVLCHYQVQIEDSRILKTLNLKSKQFVVVSCHREENIDAKDRVLEFVRILNALAIKMDKTILVTAHPRTKKRLASLDLTVDERVKFITPVGFFDYVKLQLEAVLVCSDSGTLTEEASILGFDAINLRDTHERHEAMQNGVAMLSSFDADSVVACVDILDGLEVKPTIPEDYNVTDVSEKVVKIIKSYVPYVNKYNWRK